MQTDLDPAMSVSAVSSALRTLIETMRMVAELSDGRRR
jgi:hypothetical protein